MRAGDGVWWPGEVVSSFTPKTDGGPYRRFIHRATKVVANDPNYGESVFKVRLPEGYAVEDRVAAGKCTLGVK